MNLHLLFFFNDTATTEIYTLSLHDALPISGPGIVMADDFESGTRAAAFGGNTMVLPFAMQQKGDRKSTRLNSSHVEISYAVFCLKKKKSSPRTTTSPSMRQLDRRT